jgi:hypothetical protein
MTESEVRNQGRRRKRMIVLAVSVVVGAVLGYGYYRLVGCSTGSCPITSNPWVSTLYGGVLGGLLGGGAG